MAKKKTVDKINTNTLEVINNLKSQGNVKIKVFNGDKLYKIIEQHNTGTFDLCKYVRDIMIGYVSSINQPSIIKPCDTNINGDLIPISNQGVPFISRWRGKDVKESLSSVAVIKFIIPWTQLSVGREIWGFQLFSKDQVLYAYIKLDIPIQIYAQTNIEVEWSLKISPSTNA